MDKKDVRVHFIS